MALEYKIEYANDNTMARDESIYIHLLREVEDKSTGEKIYYDHTTKEEYLEKRIDPETGSVYRGWHRRKPYVRRPSIQPVKIQGPEPGATHPFIDELVALPGVVEFSVKSYRIWVMKATAFYWTNPYLDEQWSVLPGVMQFLMLWFEETTLKELPGSQIGLNPIGVSAQSDTVRRSISRGLITKDRRRL